MQKRTLDSRFDSDFTESLKEKIEFDDSDTAEQRELKQAVIDTKAEIASRMESGEKPSDMLNEVTENLYELGRYKRDLQTQLTKFKLDSNYTDKDIVDFVTAANQMLRSKGAKELPMPNFMIRQVSLRLAAKREMQKQEMTK